MRNTENTTANQEREVSEEQLLNVQLLNDQTPDKYNLATFTESDDRNLEVQLEHATYRDLKAQQLPQKFELIKNFRHDENQVIIEESREETSLNFDSCSFVI